jgi:hypothetical protein
LHPKTINGVKMLLCTRCIKKINKEQALAKVKAA